MNLLHIIRTNLNIKVSNFEILYPKAKGIWKKKETIYTYRRKNLKLFGNTVSIVYLKWFKICLSQC